MQITGAHCTISEQLFQILPKFLPLHHS